MPDSRENQYGASAGDTRESTKTIVCHADQPRSNRWLQQFDRVELNRKPAFVGTISGNHDGTATTR
jgi:hypothetical protein